MGDCAENVSLIGCQNQMQMANMGYDEHMPAQTPAGGMSERVHSPWQGDYDFPPSAGPVSKPFRDLSNRYGFGVNLICHDRWKNSSKTRLTNSLKNEF